MTAPDPRLTALLVCPVTRSRLVFDPEREVLVAVGSGLAWPVVDGIPQLLPHSRPEAAEGISQAHP
ncbi:Trm112 family protein [Thermaurantiacus sp.]